MSAPTIGERLTALERHLTLIKATAKGATVKGGPHVELDDVIVAIGDVATEAYEHLFWLKQAVCFPVGTALPPNVLDALAPSDDERVDMGLPWAGVCDDAR